MRRPSVLVVAESANPESSSASLVGWSLTHALRAHADVHLATHVRNREALLRAGWEEGRDFTCIDPGRVERPTTRFGEAVRKVTRLGWSWTTAFSTLSYYYFEELLWRRFALRLQSRAFDIVHRITPSSPAVPSLIAGRLQVLGIPFVWGPVNGGVPWPKEFRSALRREGEWLSYVRGARKLLPSYRRTRTAASALLAGSRYVWRDFKGYQAKTVYLPENAVDPERLAGLGTAPSGGPLRVAFVGRLVPLKGVDMLVEAAAPLLRSGELFLDVIGDGPEMAALRQQVEAEGVTEAVSFSGWIEQQDVLRRLASAHVLGFPSIREFGGGVVLEAMALGVVPIVVDHGGPAELVTEETGFRVPLGSRAALVAAFRARLEALARSREQLASMGRRGRAYVSGLFTWEVKARQLLEVYRWVLGERDKPDFGMPLKEEVASTPRTAVR